MIFLFIRFLPVISITEMRELVHETQSRARTRRGRHGGLAGRRRHERAHRRSRRFTGLLAEFDKPEDVLAATRDAYAQGYRFMEAYTPFPVEGLAEALGFHHNGIARIVLLGGLAAGSAAFS